MSSFVNRSRSSQKALSCHRPAKRGLLSAYACIQATKHSGIEYAKIVSSPGRKGKAFCKMSVSVVTELEVLYEVIAITPEFVLFKTRLDSAAIWLYQMDRKVWQSMGEPAQIQMIIKPV